jgi:pyruvate/2-oxoglutarate dehydrogenase complex dihydrolipoamide dehydrogenase (E3) component
MIPIMGFCQMSVFAGYAIYLPELFPVSLRSTGTSFCYNVGRFLAAAGPYSLGQLSVWLTPAVAAAALDTEKAAAKLQGFRDACCWMSLVFIVGIIAVRFLPETKGLPLPEDQDAAQLIEEVFRRNGMQVLSKSRAESAVNTGNGVEVTLSDGTVVKGSHCLIAVGSIPNTAGLGLEEAGIELNETGHIVVNKVARTSRANVYGVGDCTTFLPLASVSAMQGRTAVFHTMGDVAMPAELRNVASNVFTNPEIASVGWSQKAIEEGLVDGSIFKVMLDTNPRAKIGGIQDGFVKLFCSAGSGTVIGGVVVAPRASELIYPIALAVENRLNVDQVAKTFAVYPSMSASVTEAARALHRPNV